jgi:hypothetical protein
MDEPGYVVADRERRERDTLLLQSIAEQDSGTIVNIVQAAVEYGDLAGKSLYDRLSMAYYELTNRDDGGDTMIGLVDE